jgi:hypothetical protein
VLDSAVILWRESPGKGEGTGRAGQGKAGKGKGSRTRGLCCEGRKEGRGKRLSSRGEVVSAGFALVGSKHRKVSLALFQFGLVWFVLLRKSRFGFSGNLSECCEPAAIPEAKGLSFLGGGREAKVAVLGGERWRERERGRERASDLGFAKVVNLVPAFGLVCACNHSKVCQFFPFSCFGFYFVFSAWRICGAGIFEV